MKKMMIMFMMLICAVSLNAQKIEVIKDEMTDKEYKMFVDSKGEKGGTILSEDGKTGLSLQPSIDETLSDIIVKVYKRGFGCVEGGIMIIKFKDGSKIQLSNWKSFNCDETMYFKANRFKDELSTKPIDKIMVQNGRSYETETQVIPNPNYFIELYSCLK